MAAPVPYTPSASLEVDVLAQIGAIVDVESFMELQQEWAKSSVVGRARIGGIAVGVIANRPVGTQKTVPVDPGDLDSAIKTMSQSGSLFYPDSTLKTSQALKDIDREGLPVVFFANLRGFSGGTTDMFQEILKFGAGIVHALESMEQKVNFI